MLDDRASGPRGATRSNAPHGLQAGDACPTCRITVAEFLDRLPRNAVIELPSRTTTLALSAGDVLCVAGHAVRVLYVLRAGRMKIREGGRVVKICRAGEILGGGAVAAGLSQNVDFIALDACRIDTIALPPARLRAPIVSAIRECAEAAHRPPRAQAIVLSTETIARLARVLIGLGCFVGEETDDGVRLPLTLSHQRISQVLAMPESAVAHLFEELETRGILYADDAGVTVLTPTRVSVATLVHI